MIPKTRNQQNIVLRTTPPSPDSLAEGQIVFAMTSNKGLNMYTKRKGQLWETSFYKKSHKRVIDDLDVRGKAIFLKDLTVRGSIYGKQTVMFNHNFSDDIDTTEHYLPWTDQLESLAPASTSVVTSFLCPYKMTLKKILFRADIVTQQADVTFKVKRIDSGDVTVDTVATAEYDATIAADTTFELNRSDFDSTPEIPENALAAMSITTDADISQGGVQAAFLITSTWEVEIFI